MGDHHDHDHDHDHPEHGGRGRAGGPLERIAHVRGGPPVLDVGDGIGAVVLLVDRSLVGTEVFVADDGGRQVHTGVWLRNVGVSEVAAAVFCELPEGRYTLLDPADRAGQVVAVTGGQVVELDCRMSV